MTNPDDRSSVNPKRKFSKRPKWTGSLSISNWILVIISFIFFAYALYTIKTRIIESSVKNDMPKSDISQPL